MTDTAKQQSLAALEWLVEAGADEAIGDEPVNRFAIKKSDRPLEGGSKAVSRDSAKTASGRGDLVRSDPSPKFASQISTLPQGEGKEAIEGDDIATAQSARRRCKLARGIESRAGILRRLRLEAHRHQHRLRRRQSRLAHHVHRRSAGPRRRPPGPALRRARRKVARQDAGGDRARPHRTLTSPM